MLEQKAEKIVINKNTTNSCMVCGNRKIHYDFSIDKFRIEDCIDCGLMRLNPQPSDQELKHLYNKNYLLKFDDNQAHTSALKSNTASHYLDLIESYTKAPLKGRLLEIRCGQGGLTSLGLNIYLMPQKWQQQNWGRAAM